MYLCVRSIGVCLSFSILLHDFGIVLTVWYFSTWFRNSSDSVVFFDMISELFWRCGIFPTWFLNCSDSLVFFDMISELFWQCSISCMISELFWQCGICDMISELFWQCGIFFHDFWTILTVWYFSTWFLNCSDSVVFLTWFLNCSDSVVFPTWFRNCSDSVVFFCMCLYKPRKVNCQEHRYLLQF
jgi:hypothetical protein